MTKARLAIALSLIALFAIAGCAAKTDSSGPLAALRGGHEGTPQSRTLYLSAIEQLIADDKSYAALAHLDEFELHYGQSDQSLKLRGDAWLAIGALDKAEQAYKSIGAGAIAGFGSNGLGRVAAARGDWAAAVRQFSAAVATNPTNADFLNNLGHGLTQTAQYEAAELALRKAFELAPTDTQIAQNLVLLLEQTGRQDDIPKIFSRTGAPPETHGGDAATRTSMREQAEP